MLLEDVFTKDGRQGHGSRGLGSRDKLSPANAESLLSSSIKADVKLRAAIERTVRTRTGCRVRDLHVNLDGNHVTLTGHASTYYAKQLATQAALDELQSYVLFNRIEVD